MADESRSFNWFLRTVIIRPWSMNPILVWSPDMRIKMSDDEPCCIALDDKFRSIFRFSTSRFLSNNIQQEFQPSTCTTNWQNWFTYKTIDRQRTKEKNSTQRHPIQFLHSGELDTRSQAIQECPTATGNNVLMIEILFPTEHQSQPFLYNTSQRRSWFAHKKNSVE